MARSKGWICSLWVYYGGSHSWKAEQSEDLSLTKPSAAGTFYSITLHNTDSKSGNVNVSLCYFSVMCGLLIRAYDTSIEYMWFR